MAREISMSKMLMYVMHSAFVTSGQYNGHTITCTGVCNGVYEYNTMTDGVVFFMTTLTDQSSVGLFSAKSPLLLIVNLTTANRHVSKFEVTDLKPKYICLSDKYNDDPLYELYTSISDKVKKASEIIETNKMDDDEAYQNLISSIEKLSMMDNSKPVPHTEDMDLIISPFGRLPRCKNINIVFQGICEILSDETQMIDLQYITRGGHSIYINSSSTMRLKYYKYDPIERPFSISANLDVNKDIFINITSTQYGEILRLHLLQLRDCKIVPIENNVLFGKHHPYFTDRFLERLMDRLSDFINRSNSAINL